MNFRWEMYEKVRKKIIKNIRLHSEQIENAHSSRYEDFRKQKNPYYSINFPSSIRRVPLVYRSRWIATKWIINCTKRTYFIILKQTNRREKKEILNSVFKISLSVKIKKIKWCTIPNIFLFPKVKKNEEWKCRPQQKQKEKKSYEKNEIYSESSLMKTNQTELTTA